MEKSARCNSRGARQARRWVRSRLAPWRRSGALIAAGLFVLLAGLPLALRAADAPAPPAVPVVIAVAQLQELAPVVWYPASVISRRDARLAAEVAGRLVEVAEVGTRVQAGEAVARLDDTLLRQSEAEQTALIRREQARLVLFSAEVSRLSRLARQNNAAQSQLDQAVADRDVARSELTAAQARLAQTRERLARTVLRTPFPAVITERRMQAGEWAEAGAAVVRVVDPAALEVQAWVPARALSRLSPGTALIVREGTAGSSRNAQGRLRALVPVGDDTSRLFEVRVALGAAQTALNWPAGKSLQLGVPTAASRQVVTVPRDALVLRRDGISVYRVGADDGAERVRVETGEANGSRIEVRGDIRPGDRVVIRGGERLRPGQKVRILNPGFDAGSGSDPGPTGGAGSKPGSKL